MNAGFASAAPQPPPPGPQASVAPAGDSASSKPAGEAFGAHLARAIAAKAPTRAVDDPRPAEQTIDRPTEPSARVEKTDRPTSKAEVKSAAPQKDEDQASAANSSGSDAAAQAQVASAVAALSLLPQKDAPAKTVDSVGSENTVDAKAQVILPVDLVAADVADTQAAEALADLKLAPATIETAKSDLAANLIDSAATQAQDAKPQALTPSEPKTDQAKPALAQQTEAAKLSAEQAQIAEAKVAHAQDNQANLAQAASQQSVSADDRQGAPATAGKAGPGATKTGAASVDGKTAKSELATPSLPTGAEGVVLATASKSGGEGAGGDDPRHEFDGSSAPGPSVDGAPPQAGPADGGQPPLQAPVHIAPQTLQTAAVAMKSGPQTVAGLAAQIVSKFDGSTTRFDVELHPLDLGRVDVRLEVGAGGQISAAMSFDNPQAAAEMRARSADLQKALENAGFNLSGGLSFDVAGDRGQGGSQNSGAEPGLAQRARALETAANAATEAADTAMTQLMSAYGAKPSRGVDIRI